MQRCVQSDVLTWNQKNESTALFRLLTQTIEAPKKEIGLSEGKTHTEQKAEKDDSD